MQNGCVKLICYRSSVRLHIKVDGITQGDHMMDNKTSTNIPNCGCITGLVLALLCILLITNMLRVSNDMKRLPIVGKDYVFKLRTNMPSHTVFSRLTNLSN